MEWHGVSPRIHSVEPHDALRNRKFLNNNHINRFSNDRDVLVDQRRTGTNKRRSMTKSPRKDASEEKHPNCERKSKAEMHKRQEIYSNGGDYALSQTDLEESGYIEGVSGLKNTETVFEGSNLVADSSSIVEGIDGEFDGQFDPAVEANKRFFGSSIVTRGDVLHNGINSMSHEMLSMSFSSSICSDGSSLDGDFTYEHSRLTTVLNSIDPKRLHNYLKRKLKQRDSGTILALGTLLPKKRFKGETLHCVRCHKEYDPKHGDKTCELFHRKVDVMKISEDESGADFACERCGNVFRIDGKWKYKESLNKKYKCGPCFTGVHTVSTDEVLQEENGISKTCEDYGCIVFYV